MLEQSTPSRRFTSAVYKITWVSLPDKLHETWKGHPKKNHPHKAALKLHLRFDVLTGGFQHFQLTDGMTADSTAAKASEPLPPGSLRLADLAIFRLMPFEDSLKTGSNLSFESQLLSL